MITIKKILLTCIGMSICGFLSCAQAQDKAEAPRLIEKAQMEQRVGEMYRWLHLTEDQKKKLEANKQHHRSRIENIRQGLRVVKEALRVELMKSSLDMLKVNAIHNQIKVFQSQMEDEKLSSILEVRGILTPEQFSKFVNWMQKRKKEQRF